MNGTTAAPRMNHRREPAIPRVRTTPTDPSTPPQSNSHANHCPTDRCSYTAKSPFRPSGAPCRSYSTRSWLTSASWQPGAEYIAQTAFAALLQLDSESQLRKGFTVSPALQTRITDRRDLDQFETWFDRVLTAQSLSDVFPDAD